MKVNGKRVVNLFLSLFAIDSESGNEKQIIDFLRKELLNVGMSTSKDREGNLIAKIGNPKLLLTAHVDTVKPGNNVQVIIEGDGRIHTDGSTVLGGDDKSGVASIIEILTTLRENNQLADLEVVFTVKEEIGNIGALGLDFSKLQSKTAINFDSEPGDIIIGEPEKFHFDITITGKAAHAGDHPERGIDAILTASKAVSMLPWGRLDNETTANLGLFSGGIARNIVSEHVHLEAEIRSRSKQKLNKLSDNLIKTFENEARLSGTTVEIDKIASGWTYSIDRDNKFVQIMAAICKRNEIEPDIMVIGGNTDAGLFNQNGIFTITTGSCGKEIHTTNEYITKDTLIKGTQIGLEIVLSFMKKLGHACE